MALAEDGKAWLKRPFPDQVAESSDLVFELTSIDTFAAGCLDTYVSDGSLDDERVGILESCERELRSLLPKVPKEYSAYFVELAALCQRVLGAMGRRN